MKKNLILIILFSLILLGLKGEITKSNNVTNISKSFNEKSSWVNLGLGASSHLAAKGFNFSVANGKKYFSLRGVHNQNLSIWDNRPEKVWDFGALFGLNQRASKGFASIATGLAFVGGNNIKNEKTNSKTFQTIGLPLELQLFWTPFSKIGFGIYGFGNLNSKESFAGVLISIKIGNN